MVIFILRFDEPLLRKKFRNFGKKMIVDRHCRTKNMSDNEFLGAKNRYSASDKLFTRLPVACRKPYIMGRTVNSVYYRGADREALKMCFKLDDNIGWSPKIDFIIF